MGTVAGLALGLTAAGLKTKVMAVRVTDPQYTSLPKARRLFEKAKRLLRAADPAFPDCPFPDSFEFRHEFFGDAYGLYTEAGMRAVRLLRDAEGINIEGTYTGKAFAALLADAEAGRLRGKTVLFWHTYNTRAPAGDFAKTDYHVLPRTLHRYFEEDVQPLDH
jgi:D-cysteine desulfhydrase